MARADVAFRYDAIGARKVLQSFIPDDKVADAIGRLVAAIVEEVNRVAPNSWNLTLRRRDLFLNVGQVAVMTVERGEVFLCSTPLAKKPPRLIYFSADQTKSVYDAVRIPSVALRMGPDRVVGIEQAIVRGVRAFAKKAAIAKGGSPWKTAHSPAAIEYFAECIGQPIAQPGYFSGTIVEEGGDVTPAELDHDLKSMREVEQDAILRVTKHYQEAGWKVTSREAEKVGYDLDCRKRGEVRHLEVKGRSGSGETVIVTSGEWNRAYSDRNWWLAIVAFAGGAQESLNEVHGRALLSEFSVDPVAFRLTRTSKKKGRSA